MNMVTMLSLTSRMLHCDKAESSSPGLTWLEIAAKVQLKFVEMLDPSHL